MSAAPADPDPSAGRAPERATATEPATAPGPGPARAWLAWVATGAAAGAVLGWRAAWTNASLRGSGDALLAEGYAALAYGLLGAAVGLLVLLEIAVLGRLLRGAGAPTWRFGAHALAATATLGAYAVGSLGIVAASRWATEVDRRAVAAGLAGALLVQLLAAAVLACAARAGRVPAIAWWGRAVVAALVLVPLATVAGLVPARSVAGAGEPPAVEAAPGAVPRVVLLGIDGADWVHLQPLLDAGRLPNLARLVDEGTSAPLRTLLPTWSPTIWTSVATGRPPEEHGVLDFTEVPLPGFALGVQRLRAVERLAQDPGLTPWPMPTHVGLTPLVYGLVEAGVLREEPIRAYHRRVKALWNVLSDRGLPVGVVRWWATWPAEEVHGALVSDNAPRGNACHVLEQLAAGPAADLELDPTITHPPDLLARAAVLDEAALADPARRWGAGDERAEARRVVETWPLFADLDAEHREALVDDPGLPKLVLNIAEEDRFAVQSARAVLADHDPRLLAVYLQGVDAIGHRIEFHAKRDPRFLAVIDRYWERVDAHVGELRAAVGEDATWLVVSDHGWSYAAGRYGHYHAPDGVFLLSGPAARAGARLEGPGPHVLDVAPTVLGLLGLPASEEMPGTAVTAALLPAVAAELPRERVPSWGAHRPVWSAEAAGGTGGTREDVLETLRELGYVQ